MKKIIFSLLLLFTFTYAETPIQSDVGKWRRFFGVEAGVGKMSIYPAFVFSLNVFDFYRLTGASYGGGILGGWQKYTYEKVGMRNTLGLRVFGAKDTKAKKFEDYKQYEGELIIDSAFYYALDGLFDFVKNGDNRFGMSLGLAIGLFQLTTSQNLFGMGWLHLAPRVGFYAQFDHHLFDFIFSVPLIGGGGGRVSYNSTFTLGYKYLF